MAMLEETGRVITLCIRGTLPSFPGILLLVLLWVSGLLIVPTMIGLSVWLLGAAFKAATLVTVLSLVGQMSVLCVLARDDEHSSFP